MGNPITKDVTTEEEVFTSTPKERPALRLADRCDRCGAQAFAAAYHAVHGTLLFCGHHFNKHQVSLVEQGFEMQDETHKINDKPSVSANAD